MFHSHMFWQIAPKKPSQYAIIGIVECSPAVTVVVIHGDILDHHVIINYIP